MRSYDTEYLSKTESIKTSFGKDLVYDFIKHVDSFARYSHMDITFEGAGWPTAIVHQNRGYNYSWGNLPHPQPKAIKLEITADTQAHWGNKVYMRIDMDNSTATSFDVSVRRSTQNDCKYVRVVTSSTDFDVVLSEVDKHLKHLRSLETKNKAKDKTKEILGMGVSAKLDECIPEDKRDHIQMSEYGGTSWRFYSGPPDKYKPSDPHRQLNVSISEYTTRPGHHKVKFEGELTYASQEEFMAFVKGICSGWPSGPSVAIPDKKKKR